MPNVAYATAYASVCKDASTIMMFGRREVGQKKLLEETLTSCPRYDPILPTGIVSNLRPPCVKILPWTSFPVPIVWIYCTALKWKACVCSVAISVAMRPGDYFFGPFLLETRLEDGM